MNYQQFTELREGLTALWSETPEPELEARFTGAVAQSQRALMSSAYKGTAALDIREPQIARHIEALQSGPETHGWANAFLALSLHEWAHRLPPPPDLAHVPDWLLSTFLEFQFAAPTLFRENGDADMYIARLEQWFDIILANVEGPDGRYAQAACVATEKAHSHVFGYLSEQSVRNPITKARQIQAHLMAQDGHVLAHKLAVNPKRTHTRTHTRTPEHRRLGLYRACWSGTELLFVLPLLRHLDRDEFEVVLFADESDESDEEALCRGYADSFVLLPAELKQAVAEVRSQDLDLLLIATFLAHASDRRAQFAMHRLARRQATYFTSPTTSGMPHMDYFLTATGLDPQADDDYSETAVLLPDPGLCFDREYFEELWRPPALARAKIGVEEDEILFICTGALAKISAAQRSCWYEILKRLPQARVLTTPISEASMLASLDAVRRTIAAELASAGLDQARVIVSDARGSDTIRAHTKLADVFLNTFPFGGSASLVENLLFGPPPVVMRGQRLASRMAEVIMRELGLDDLITDTPREFVELACRLGEDRNFRETARMRIKAAMAEPSRIFDMARFGAEANRVLLDLAQ